MDLNATVKIKDDAKYQKTRSIIDELEDMMAKAVSEHRELVANTNQNFNAKRLNYFDVSMLNDEMYAARNKA